MQIYSSSEFYGDYHANFPVTRSHMTNGMRTRLASLRYALQYPVITDIKDGVGALLIEPFVIKIRPEQREQMYREGWEKAKELEERYIQEVCDYNKGPKYMLCTEMQIFRMLGNVRNRILEGMSGVFSPCVYHQKLLRTINIDSKVVFEPVNEYLFYPNEKKQKQILAVGSATHVKNTESLIAFYRALEGKGYHRIFIGGPIVWGRREDTLHAYHTYRYNMELYRELETVCDEFHPPLSHTKIAMIMAASEYYVNFAYHEVACLTSVEALMSGCGIIWGEHPLGKEMPVVCMTTDIGEAINAVEATTGNVDVAAIRDHALKKHSFLSVKKQMEGYLYAN